MTTSFTYSTFTGKTDNIPREITETGPQLIKRFTKPAIRANKDGPLWSPAIFKKKRRLKENVIELSMLVLDIDGGMTVDQADKILRELGALALIYTTHSHQRVTPEHPKAQDCFRVVVLLADPISADNHPRLWHWANDLFDGKIDAGCKDASRMYYLPAIASKGAPFVFRNYVGAPLDCAALDLPEESDTDSLSEQSPLDLSTDPVSTPGAYYDAAIDGEIDRIRTAPTKGRNNAYNKAVYNLARLGIDRATVETELIPEAERIGLTKREIRDTFESAYNAGLKNPRIIQSRRPMQTSQQTTQAKKSSNGAGASNAGQAKQGAQAGNGAGAQNAKQSANTGASSQTTQGKQTSGQKKKAPARRRKVDLIELVQKRATLFHDPEGRQYASIKVNSHVETRAIRSEAFALWVCGAHFEETGMGLQSEEFSKTIKTIQAIAQFQGTEKRVHLRVAEHDEKIYVDLCNAQWNVIEITPDNWRIIEAAKAPVVFTRRGGMLALPEPVQGGDLAELRRLINCEQPADDDSWALSSAWLAMFFHARGPYPILSVGGEQGSGKSTTCRMLQRLVDPNAGDLRGIPKEERDLMIAANNCRLLAYDNLSGVSLEISDRLCRISTGAGFGTRTLHTNDEETIFAARRPILVNGIADVQYGDFQDRNVSIYQRAIPDDQRRDEKKLWEDFMTARPQILGALLSSVSHALKNSATVKLDRKPRMADFALWAVAAEPGLGLSDGAFMKAYEGNRAVAHEIALDTSPAIEIREFMDSLTAAEWEGRASDLLKELNAILARKNEDPKTKYGWPQNPTRMGGDLRRVTPHLRSVGIDVEPTRTNGKRLIRIAKKKP
jgi:energy-coupling factor transporter ATP-binding protein EcfA2